VALYSVWKADGKTVAFLKFPLDPKTLVDIPTANEVKKVK